MVQDSLALWHKAIEAQDTSLLSDMLADDVVFHSPVVHKPQEGKALTFMYLSAAFSVLAGDDFEYKGEFLSETGAVLEFRTVIDGVEINGVDMITWNDKGKICDFKVMLRPLKAVNKVHELMAAMLQRMAGENGKTER
ncbi:MAG: nuclear transport factor 2 family protein [Kordiimonas sp.]